MTFPISSTQIPLCGAASSLIGGRPENQDDLGWVDTPLGFLLVVCDGMGGGPGGKTASSIVKYVVMKTIQDSPAQADRTLALKKAITLANDALNQRTDEVPQLRGMGSTIVAILLNRQSALIAHLGDSRCYRLHGNQVLFRTQDHSLVGELVRNRAITEEQARQSPQSNVILRGLGSTNNHVAEINEVPFRKGDRFILCTDGVWGIMPHAELLQRLCSPFDAHALVNNVQTEVDRVGASSGGHHDNHTLAVIDMNMDSILKDNMSKQVKIILATLSSLLFVSLAFNVIGLLRPDGSRELKEKVFTLTQQNSSLKQELEVSTQFINSNERERIMQLTLLKDENNQLQQNIDALQKQVDSLLSLKSAQNPIEADAKNPVQTQKHGVTGNPPQTKTKTAQELATLILNQYSHIEEIQGSNQKAVFNQVSSIRDSIVDELDRLGSACDKQKRCEDIKRIVPKTDVISVHISRHPSLPNVFIPNKDLIKLFHKSKEKVEELQNEL